MSTIGSRFLKFASALMLGLLSACNPAGGAASATPAATSTRPVTPPPAYTATPASPIASLELDPDLLAALKTHTGLEDSITAGADGRYFADVTMLGGEEPAAGVQIEVDPASLTEKVELIDKYDDTPVMMAADGMTKMYWIQEEAAWFGRAPENGTIHAPWIIPLGHEEISTRIARVEHTADFSQAAIDWWSTHQYGNGLYFGFAEQNVYTHEGARFGHLNNGGILDRESTHETAQVTVINDWYAVRLPDGTLFRFFQLKWLDPSDPRDPNPNEWKIINVAPGTEITENEHNRESFMYNLLQTRGDAPAFGVLPIFKADGGFLGNPTPLLVLPISQPSLEKLFTLSDNDLADLKAPLLSDYGDDSNNDGKPDGLTYSQWIDETWSILGLETRGYLISLEITNKDYDDAFFVSEIQSLIFPALLMVRQSP